MNSLHFVISNSTTPPPSLFVCLSDHNGKATDSSYLIIRYLGGKHLDTILMVDSGKGTGHLANKDEPVIQGHSRHISVKILGWGSC